MSRSPESPNLPGALRVRGLRKRVGGFMLDADFDVGAGERIGLVGRSGSGKTSLLRVLAGLDPAEGPGEGGRILAGDLDLTHLPPAARDIGLVFQDHALFPSLDVLGNVTFALRMRGVAAAERERIAAPWLERAGLASLARSPIERLSGGEAQRVALLRSMIWKPRVLLLDEPFSALDARLRGSLRQLVLELHSLWPAPMILVSHDEADLGSLVTGRLLISETNRDGDRDDVRQIRRLTSGTSIA